jgi:hypothetical protein
VVNVHLFTDAKDNKSVDQQRLSRTTLAQKLDLKGRLKDIYFTVLYNYGPETEFLHQLQQQLPECALLNTKTTEFPQTLQSLDEQRKNQIEQVKE